MPVIGTSLTVILACVLSYNVIAKRSVHYNEYATFRDGKEVAAFLSDTVKPGDKVLAYGPANMPLWYYLNKMNGSAGCLFLKLENSNRVFVIVNFPTTGPKETLNDIMAKGNITDTDFTSPLLVKKFRFSSIYKVNRKEQIQKNI
jgi:hypothetical protein